MSEPALAAAIAALAGGRAITVGGLCVAAVETASDEMLETLDPGGTAGILVSAERAVALGLGNERAVVPGDAVAIHRSDWLDATLVRALADAGRDFDRLLPGALEAVEPDDPRSAKAALALARLAGLLPALWLLPEQGSETLSVEPELLDRPVDALIAARARLPLNGIDNAQIAIFRDALSGAEHAALLIGSWGDAPPLVRMHSECLTGDVFGSLKCDCGPQLHEALALIAAAGGGLLLYLRQEGRGIGLANKIRAYALQDRGLDTVDANRRLGFADDARDYRMAAAMLRELGIGHVRLLTNNPAKVEALVAEGITVVERVAHHMPVNPHNADYVETKKRRSGHYD